MFVTSRQAHWMRDLPILKILSVMLLLGCVLAMIRQAYVVNGLKSYGVSTDIKQSSKQIASRWGWLCYGTINVEWDRALFVYIGFLKSIAFPRV